MSQVVSQEVETRSKWQSRQKEAFVDPLKKTQVRIELEKCHQTQHRWFHFALMGFDLDKMHKSNHSSFKSNLWRYWLLSVTKLLQRVGL